MNILKKTFSIFIFLMSTLAYGEQAVEIRDSKSPLIAVVLMVKNEANLNEDDVPVVIATLQPFVDAGITSILLYDTGSTDDTVACIQKYFDEEILTNAYIEQEPFIDFATSRNRALKIAEEKFPNAVFLIMPDAEWYLNNAEGLLSFCKQHEHETIPCYGVRIDAGFDFYVHRLIRVSKHPQFSGATHETVICTAEKKVDSDVYFDYDPSEEGEERSQKRWQRDVAILKAEVEKNPHDSRSLFYLASTYSWLNDNEQAYKYFLQRAELSTWDEEDYETRFRLGQVAERLAEQGLEHYNRVREHYRDAFTMRPKRAEPLVSIALTYQKQNNKPLCYLYARMAHEIPEPLDETLFVYSYYYGPIREDLIAECGDYKPKRGMPRSENLLRENVKDLGFFLEEEDDFIIQ